MLALGSGLLMIYSIPRLRRCKSLKSNEEGVCVHVSFFGLEPGDLRGLTGVLAQLWQ